MSLYLINIIVGTPECWPPSVCEANLIFLPEIFTLFLPNDDCACDCCCCVVGAVGAVVIVVVVVAVVVECYCIL